jgi:class 3 adenylate cyclase
MSNHHHHHSGSGGAHHKQVQQDFGTLVLTDGVDTLSDKDKYATIVQAMPWAQAVSRNSEHPNVDVVLSSVVFGRNADCTVRFPTNKAISGKHCRLFRESASNSSKVWLEDLSTNGTFLNGEKIGKGNKVIINSGAEFTLIPRGAGRAKVSYILYVHEDEKHKNEKAPEGTVTFVFTDVQGSTKLWEAKPDAMDISLRNHDRILRRLLSRFKGYEVKTEGDAFMVTFFHPLDAIRWCIAVQKALCDCDWPDDILKEANAKKELDSTNAKTQFNGIRIRMGLHVGQPNCRVNPITHRMDYFGQVVNRTARVSDSAHGGQIVCTQELLDIMLHAKKEGTLTDTYKPAQQSNSPTSPPPQKQSKPAQPAAATAVTAATAKATEQKDGTPSTKITQTQIVPEYHLPQLDFEVTLDDIEVRDLGNHSLKGINHPIKIYQLSAPDFTSRKFPALRAGRVKEDLIDVKKTEAPAAAAAASPEKPMEKTLASHSD